MHEERQPVDDKEMYSGKHHEPLGLYGRISQAEREISEKVKLKKDSKKKIDSPIDMYIEDIARFSMLTREEEFYIAHRISRLKNEMIYNLCMLPPYERNLEYHLRDAHPDGKQNHDSIVLFGKDRQYLSIRSQLNESLNTVDMINKQLENLYSDMKNSDDPEKRDVLRRYIAIKKMRKSELLRRFNISKRFLNAHINYLANTSSIRKMFTAEDKKRIRRLVKANEEYAALFNRVIAANLRLVISIANKYTGWNRRMNSVYMDIIQEGNKGLMAALERFDYRSGNKFCTYATYWVRQFIRRGAPEMERTIHIPCHVRENLNKICKSIDIFKLKDDGNLDVREIADKCELSVGDVKNALPVFRASRMSLDQTGLYLAEETPVKDVFCDDKADDPVDAAEKNDLRMKVHSALEKLNERERRIIKLRFGICDGKKKTLELCGDEFKISKERARQIQNSGIRKLRHRARNLLILCEDNGNKRTKVLSSASL